MVPGLQEVSRAGLKGFKGMGFKGSPHTAENAVASSLTAETPVTTRQTPTILLRRFDPTCPGWPSKFYSI